jgi:hypothetical protein
MPSVVYPSPRDFPAFPAFAPVPRRSRGICELALPRYPLRRESFGRGSPGFADGEGRKADFTGIGPVHLAWTVVDGAWSLSDSD